MMSQHSLTIGDNAPDFTLRSSTDSTVNLYSVLERSAAVLFFYVRAFTPVCTAEVCAFRDSAQEFEQFGAALFGISPDREGLARKFASRYKLPYPLLIDEGGEVRKQYGVPKLFGVLPGRSTYVIATDHKILHVTHAGLQSDRHIVKSLQLFRNQRSAASGKLSG
jgi:thioredoxin-dependent peroxiredoxin